jgi:hypothetical protein
VVPDTLSDSFELQSAKKYQIVVVTPSFIDACVAAKVSTAFFGLSTECSDTLCEQTVVDYHNYSPSGCAPAGTPKPEEQAARRSLKADTGIKLSDYQVDFYEKLVSFLRLFCVNQ